MTAYFDEDEYEASPIKYDITLNKYNGFLTGEATQYINVNKNTLVTYDSPIGSVFNKTNNTFYDFSLERVSFGDFKEVTRRLVSTCTVAPQRQL